MSIHAPKQILKLFAMPGRIEAGADEAGRGALISRVMAAAVIFPTIISDDAIPMVAKIRDSKKLSPAMREQLYEFIKSIAVSYSFGWADEKEIDDVNIRQATMNSFHKAFDGLSIRPEHLLVDGPYFQDYICPIKHREIPFTCIIQGDNAFISIAAAAILAKVERDHYIKHLCDADPSLDTKYGLLSNMGYGTAEHCKGIKTCGISPFHRKSFGICNSDGATKKERVIVPVIKTVVTESLPEWNESDELI